MLGIHAKPRDSRIEGPIVLRSLGSSSKKHGVFWFFGRRERGAFQAAIIFVGQNIC